jgi:undecaprenyl-diphosphatase
LHYPTDILAGAVIGVVIVLMCNMPFVIEKVSKPILTWADTKPELFYPVFFMISYQIADMFDNTIAFPSFFKSLMMSFKDLPC